MRARIVITCTTMLGLSACASIPKTQNTPLTAENTNGLSARVLADGECGLFVWSAGPAKTFILYGQSPKSRASWQSPTGEITLSVSAQSGVPAQGQYPQQSFNGPNAQTLTLDLKGVQPIENGTRYRLGTLTQRSAEGWDRITPVVGLSACKNAAS